MINMKRRIIEKGKNMNKPLPPISILSPTNLEKFGPMKDELDKKISLIDKYLSEVGIKSSVMRVRAGPVITQFELSIVTGLTLSKMSRYADDLARTLKCDHIRVVRTERKEGSYATTP